MSEPLYPKRRVFFSNSEQYFQILTFDQHKDASIYVNMPEFANIRWMAIVQHDGQTGLAIEDPLESEGKLSVHGGGLTTYRAHSDNKGHQLIVRGNFLIDNRSNNLGVRHLLSIFPQEPRFLPSSPALNRPSDYLLKSEIFKPFVMIFFAVPAKRMSVLVDANFHVNDLDKIPPETGFGGFNLRYHAIVWFYYRTKHMDSWPQNTHVCYHNGYDVPFFIGIGSGECRLEIRNPKYLFRDNKLSISMPM